MLSETEFVTSLCIHCVLCNGTLLHAKSFCYKRYKENPKKFTKMCFPKLRQLEEWPENSFVSEEALFKNIFCNKSCKTKRKNRCYGDNNKFNICLDQFLDQLNDSDFFGTYGHHMEQAALEQEPSVSFMCAGSANWREMCSNIDAS